jgi:hypothetical protein
MNCTIDVFKDKKAARDYLAELISKRQNAEMIETGHFLLTDQFTDSSKPAMVFDEVGQPLYLVLSRF